MRVIVHTSDDIGVEAFKGVRSGVERRRGVSGLKAARGDGRRDPPGDKVLKDETAFTAPTRPYGNQCIEGMPHLKSGDAIAHHTVCWSTIASRSARASCWTSRTARSSSGGGVDGGRRTASCWWTDVAAAFVAVAAASTSEGNCPYEAMSGWSS
jgi:hypothetical protein